MRARISSAPWRPQPRRDEAAIEADGDLNGKRVVVMGLGRFGGGIGAVRWLASRNAHVVVTDLADRDALSESIRQLGDLDLEYDLGGHRSGILDGASLVIVSPAVPKEKSPFFAEIVARRIPWTTEINLFLARCPAIVVGVTGSAGKSTTAAMIHAALCATWTPGACYVGGNIGRSLLAVVERLTAKDVVVLELSSFQLADLPRISRRPDLAVIVSLFPHHVERHGSYDAYVDSKLNIVRGATSGTPVIIGVGDMDVSPRVAAVARSCGGRIVRAGDEPLVEGSTLPGEHNAINARCAISACRLLGVHVERARTAIRRFAGLPHRLEFVGQIDGVSFYNDSKATCPTAAATALGAFERPVIALVGGKRGDEPIEGFLAALRQHARCVICFGRGGAMVAGALRPEVSAATTAPVQTTSSLRAAMDAAAAVMRPGDAVVLAPGFESYDEFPNYEHRGRAFVEWVNGCGATPARPG